MLAPDAQRRLPGGKAAHHGGGDALGVGLLQARELQGERVPLHFQLFQPARQVVGALVHR